MERVRQNVSLLHPQLQELIFKKFAEQRFWNRKELEAATGQKPADVKKVLDTVAERVAAGPHKGEYSLNAAYRGS